jgi:acetyl esterase/lipase
MIKRAMDVFYASVGTAIDITGQDSKENHNENAMWQVPLVTAAVASFYSVTGARDRVVEVTSSSRSAQRLIKEAWGMVSLPSVKNLSLQASRLLKGAAVADRIEICGVPCFVLSREPAPELAAAIKRNRRMHQRRKPIATLSTIDELEEEESPSTHNSSCCRRPFARSSGTRYRQRDVIFHLTGGGFFAHIIASDLPYLLDWSAKTGAVVICPEYALLPEHTFPFALHQVERVYQALVSDEAVTALGFETNTIVVTGESAGGNLAAALCVKIGTAAATSAVDDDAVLISSGSPPIETTTTKTKRVPMPDALMLSCPVLNLSLELSLSRVAGTNDPVLPSGLLTAISDAYLPPELGIGKREPLASPLFASDQVLSHFPPTLLFASSQDPVLDDAVVFNQRLRSLGVDSDLFAANNMPHAYLGLGTAGFPEAQQVQQLCVNWLNRQLANEPSREDGFSRHPVDGGS